MKNCWEKLDALVARFEALQAQDVVPHGHIGLNKIRADRARCAAYVARLDHRLGICPCFAPARGTSK